MSALFLYFSTRLLCVFSLHGFRTDQVSQMQPWRVPAQLERGDALPSAEAVRPRLVTLDVGCGTVSQSLEELYSYLTVLKRGLKLQCGTSSWTKLMDDVWTNRKRLHEEVREPWEPRGRGAVPLLPWPAVLCNQLRVLREDPNLRRGKRTGAGGR